MMIIQLNLCQNCGLLNNYCVETCQANMVHNCFEPPQAHNPSETDSQQDALPAAASVQPPVLLCQQ